MQRFSELRMTLIILVIGTFFISGCFFSDKHTVTFKTNGGTEVSNVSVKSGNKIKEVKEPKKDGYVFDGWYLEGEEFDFDTKVKEDITLVAKWKRVETIEEETTTTTTSTTTTTTTKKKISKSKTTKKKKKTTKKTTTTKKVDKVNAVVPPVLDKLEENKKEETEKLEEDKKEETEKIEEDKKEETEKLEEDKKEETEKLEEDKKEETETQGTTTGETVNPVTPTPEESSSTTTKKEDEPGKEERNDKLVDLQIIPSKFTPFEGGGEAQKVTINKEDKANVYTLLSDKDVNTLLTSDMKKWSIKTNNNYTYTINNEEENVSRLELTGDDAAITSLTIEIPPTIEGESIEVFILEYVEKTDAENTKIIEWNLVRPVAETSTNTLDKQYHSDLEAAILSAPKDEIITVKLLSDIKVEEEIEIHTPVIIDGGGYTITKEEGYLFNIEKLEYDEDDELNFNNLNLNIDSMIKTGNSSFNKININNSEGIIKGNLIENDEESRIKRDSCNFRKTL